MQDSKALDKLQVITKLLVDLKKEPKEIKIEWHAIQSSYNEAEKPIYQIVPSVHIIY